MNKIIMGLVGVVVIGLLGRLGWAFTEVRKDMAREAQTKAALATADSKAKAEEARAAALLASLPKAPEGCPTTKQAGEVWVLGKVVFPKGIKATSTYSIMSNAATYPISIDGTFCALATSSGPAIITASATSSTSTFVLSAVVNSSATVQDFIIDATSTARALVYTSPLIVAGGNTDILSTIATSTSVGKLATSISTATTLSNKDIATGGKLATVYATAVKSVQPKIMQTPSTPVTTQKPITPAITPKPVVVPTPTPAPISTPITPVVADPILPPTTPTTTTTVQTPVIPPPLVTPETPVTSTVVTPTSTPPIVPIEVPPGL